jgi:hypothetical protein
MFRKIIYSLAIVAMIIAMLGVQGKGGVQTAAAAAGWNDTRTGMASTPMPYYNGAVNLKSMNNATGDLGGCSVAPSFGIYQAHLLYSTNAKATTYSYVRVVVKNTVDNIDSSWAVRVSQNGTMAELGCALNTGSTIDLVVAVPTQALAANQGFVVTLGSNGAFVPANAANFRTWIFPTVNAGSGLIVDMTGDSGGNYALRWVEASSTTQAYYEPVTSDGMAFLDVPTGTYNIGIQDQTTGEQIAVYLDQQTKTFISVHPYTLATIPVKVIMTDEEGNPLCLFVAVNTNTSLLLDLELGMACQAPDGPGVMTFHVNPGLWGWDITAYLDQSPSVGPDYFLIKRNINPALGDVIFNLKPVPTAPAAFNKTSPANGATAVAMNPTLSWGASSGAASYQYCYATTTGCTSWISTGTATSVALSGLGNSQIYYWQVQAVNTGGTTSADTGTYWSFTTTGPSFADVSSSYWAWSEIERLYAAKFTTGCSIDPLAYCPERSVTRAEMAVFIERGIHGAAYIPPTGIGTVFTDVPLSYWDVDWIEKLYVDHITSGCRISPLIYCPERSITRAEMAVFLLKTEHGADYNPPAATGIFTDVPTSYWDADWIEQLYAEEITGGCSLSPMSYCPESPVTRAEMAVFLVRTFNLP